MADEVTSAVSVERLLGGELAAAAEQTLISARPGESDPSLEARLVTTQELVELYWDLRHQRLTASAVCDSLAAGVRHRFGVDRSSPGESIRADRQAVFTEINATVGWEHVWGGELSSVAGIQPADASFEASGPAPAVRLATVQILLALHWELCHQHPGPTADGGASLEWVSALLCTPARFHHGAGLGIHHL